MYITFDPTVFPPTAVEKSAARNSVNFLPFAVLVGLGITFRRKPDLHKRLMVLAAVTLLAPAVARLVLLFTQKALPQFLPFMHAFCCAGRSIPSGTVVPTPEKTSTVSCMYSKSFALRPLRRRPGAKRRSQKTGNQAGCGSNRQPGQSALLSGIDRSSATPCRQTASLSAGRSTASPSLINDAILDLSPRSTAYRNFGMSLRESHSQKLMVRDRFFRSDSTSIRGQKI